MTVFGWKSAIIPFRCMWIILFILSYTMNLTAQDALQLKVKPGKSVGKLEVGMQSSEASEVLGTPHRQWFYEDEVDRILAAGLNQSDLYYFRVGFDEVFEFDLTPEPYPVTKLYFLGDHLVYIMMTENRSSKGEPVIPKGIRFGDTREKVMKQFGEPAIRLDFEDGSGNYIYPALGLEMNFKYDRIKEINIFLPVRNVINSSDCD